MAVQYRWVIAGIAHLGVVMIYAARVNLSVALVAMVNSSYVGSGMRKTPACLTSINATLLHDSRTPTGEFNWDNSQKGYILSSFFYGYLLTNLPGGWLASHYGGKWVLGWGVLLTSIFTLLTPMAARWSIEALIACRVVIGIAEGVTFPAIHTMLAKWSPVSERSKLAVTTYSGMHVGVILALPLSGVLSASQFGWPSVFYLFGSLGIVWFILWVLLAYNSPQEHPYISGSELDFIISSMPEEDKNTYTPWLEIFKSVPNWAIIVAHFCQNWLWYMLLTDLPLYFQQILNFDIQENGILSALPFVCAFVFHLTAGFVADHLRKHHLTTTSVRRIAGILGFFPSGIFLILSSYTDCDQTKLAVLFMTLATAFLTINLAGYHINHNDISPRYSGILMGLSNVSGTVAGCLTPLVVGYFTEDDPSRAQYRKVFFLAAAVGAFGGIFYTVFASGEEQSWNTPPASTTQNNNMIRLDSDDEEEHSENTRLLDKNAPEKESLLQIHDQVDGL